MTSHVLDYVQLPDRDLKHIAPRLNKGDKVEVRLRIGNKDDRDVQLPQPMNPNIGIPHGIEQ